MEFSAVPDGSYDFFLFFKDLDIDEYGLSSGAIWATLHNTVTVLDGQAILQGLFQEVPEDRKGLVELPDLL